MKELIEQLVKKAEAEKIQRFVVGAIISRNNKILCLKRAGHDFMPGLYELPSGKVDKGETLDTALIREVKEESHLTVAEVKDYRGHFDYQSKSGVNTRQFTFSVVVNRDDKVMLHENEHEGYSWVSQSEMNNYNISKEVKLLMEKYFNDELKANYATSKDQTLFSDKKRPAQDNNDPTITKVPTLGGDQ